MCSLLSLCAGMNIHWKADYTAVCFVDRGHLINQQSNHHGDHDADHVDRSDIINQKGETLMTKVPL